jgi:hypothetical protein
MPHILVMKNSQPHYLPVFSWDMLDEPMGDYTKQMKIIKKS